MRSLHITECGHVLLKALRLWLKTRSSGDERGHFIAVPSVAAEIPVIASRWRLTRRRSSSSCDTSELLTSELFMSPLFDCSWNPKKSRRSQYTPCTIHQYETASTLRPFLNTLLTAASMWTRRRVWNISNLLLKFPQKKHMWSILHTFTATIHWAQVVLRADDSVKTVARSYFRDVAGCGGS